VGLLDKTLKKAGKSREKVPAAAAEQEKPSVKWLGRSFLERAKVLADKIDLESQYAQLDTLSQTTDRPPPAKQSLRERAKRFLTRNAPEKALTPDPSTEPAVKRSLRDRATRFLKKITGGTGGAAGGSTSVPETGTSGTNTSSSDADLAADEELLQPKFFPWWSTTEDDELNSHVGFGLETYESAGYEQASKSAVAVSEEPAPEAEPRAPLSEFAETMERITENLRNLHVQLDQGHFIRPASAPDLAQAGVAAEQPAGPLISHHVPVDEAPGAVGQSGSAAGAGTPQREKASDVFWPKNLPLDLPARDIRLNADGSLSVVPGPFKLPYLADDIAPVSGPLSHFNRNLANAELFIAEGELQLTRIIYERLLKKITDEDAKRKIQANLDALDNYQEEHDWGNFMPLPPWMRQNSWQDQRPPTLNVSEMPVEAKSITINIDKGIFDVARAAFEQEKKSETDAGDNVAEDAETSKLGEDAETAPESELEKRTGDDRRVGAPDSRGAGAPDRRSGEGRRADEASAGDRDADGEAIGFGEADSEGTGTEELAADNLAPDESAQESDSRQQNAPPPPLAADGASAEEPGDGVMEQPDIPQMSPDGQAMAGGGGDEEGGSGEEKEEENKVQEIRGVLELKTPDQEDTPFLTLTYDFTKIPHAYRLAKDNGIFEYAYYKYKPMLVKAHQFIKRKQITRALNYYRVIREQQIPSEFRHMVDRNIKDITEYLQKYLVTRAN
jgi:hypothetical protein